MNVPVWSILLVSFVFVAHGLPTSSIVGSSVAPAGKYPYQVSVQFFDFHFCSGSILNKRHILTAAHCVHRLSPGLFTVVAGSNVLYNGGDTYRVSEIIEHNYNPVTLENDVTILRLSEDIRFSDIVQPVSLSSKEDFTVQYPAVMTGWEDFENPEIINNLQEVDVNIIPQTLCQKKWESVEILPSQVCTLNDTPQGSYGGEFGSPLVSNGKLIGIGSFGAGFGSGNSMPNVYVRVSFYKGWIIENSLMDY